MPQIASTQASSSGFPRGDTALLTCPVRGPLDASALAGDGLTPSEEKRRIDFIYYLLRRGYPAEHLDIETVVIKHLGNAGRNRVRADVVVYAIPTKEARQLPDEERFNEALLVAEIKRDSSSRRTGLTTQLEPAVRQLPRLEALGVYWDDVNRLLLFKRLVERDGTQFIEVDQDDLANLPRFGRPYHESPITLSTLTPPSNLLGTLRQLANAMRSHGVNDTHLRYKETVKLLLARYVDEKEASVRKSGELHLQVFKGRDDTFEVRVSKLYEKSARRYSLAKTLFTPMAGSELPEEVLRDVVRVIQGMHLSVASNEALQQVFMSFVPAVFKKELDQYFTPLTLIETMVSMTEIGPTDKVGDPGMGTGDFLTAAMGVRAEAGDTDMGQRILGIDKDPQAYDLAVVNMILNRDGQANLVQADSIAAADRWQGELDVVLCNPPFGANTVETRPDVLRQYALGHRWQRDPGSGTWENSGEILDSQQLGILFLERSITMLSENGRLGIIVPEGYLSTSSYGYLRQWLLENVVLLSLVELPRRMFLRSNADLRANILLAQKLPSEKLKLAQSSDYRIHTGLVRKVGYKLGKGFQPTALRDSETGLQIMGEDNTPELDTDFTRVRDSFKEFRERSDSDAWAGAHFSDVAGHPSLDMKPRRLMPRALSNIRRLRSKRHVKLVDVAEIAVPDFDVSATPSRLLRLVEGQCIRAVEGTIMPHEPERAWAILERKSSKYMYELADEDIVVGLVRPERRNIGVLLNDSIKKEPAVIGSPDGVAVIRVDPDSKDEFPLGWLFASLRSEPCRLQLWTESGGTSYGKLNPDQIGDIVLLKGTQASRERVDIAVRKWAEGVRASLMAWQKVGTKEDRAPILNSSIIGLEPDSP